MFKKNSVECRQNQLHARTMCGHAPNFFLCSAGMHTRRGLPVTPHARGTRTGYGHITYLMLQTYIPCPPGMEFIQSKMPGPCWNSKLRLTHSVLTRLKFRTRTCMNTEKCAELCSLAQTLLDEFLGSWKHIHVIFGANKAMPGPCRRTLQCTRDGGHVHGYCPLPVAYTSFIILCTEMGTGQPDSHVGE